MKVVLLGHKKVGKSAFIERFAHNTFPEEYHPTIEGHFSHNIATPKGICTLDITDIPGTDNPEFIEKGMLYEQDGYLLCYAVDDRASYESIESIYDKLIQNTPEEVDDQGRPLPVRSLPIVLLGLKKDIDMRMTADEQFKSSIKAQKAVGEEEIAAKGERQVSAREGEELAARLRIQFFEVSAKKNTGIKDALNTLWDVWRECYGRDARKREEMNDDGGCCIVA